MLVTELIKDEIKSLPFQSKADHPRTGYIDRKRGRNAESFIRIVLFAPSLEFIYPRSAAMSATQDPQL